MSFAGKFLDRISKRPEYPNRLGTFLAKCFKSIRFQICEGYEDETGFHLGVDPKTRKES